MTKFATRVESSTRGTRKLRRIYETVNSNPTLSIVLTTNKKTTNLAKMSKAVMRLQENGVAYPIGREFDDSPQ